MTNIPTSDSEQFENLISVIHEISSDQTATDTDIGWLRTFDDHDKRFRAAIQAYAATQSEKAVAEAEDKALGYAGKLYDLTKQWPEYYIKNLNGTIYRNHHKDVQVALRSNKKGVDHD